MRWAGTDRLCPILLRTRIREGHFHSKKLRLAYAILATAKSIQHLKPEQNVPAIDIAKRFRVRSEIVTHGKIDGYESDRKHRNVRIS